MTQPPRKVRLAVYERDGYRCVRCGTTFALLVHHRRLKGMGGSHAPCTDCPCNLVTLCTSCHDAVHNGARRTAEAMGYIVPRHALVLPGEIGVMRHGDGGGITSRPDCEGGWAA